MPAQQDRTEGFVEHEVRVSAHPESVFEYFTDPAKLVQWMGAEATLDPRPGGVCRVDCVHATMLGEFVEIDRPRRIVFTWGWEGEVFATPPQSTLVEVSLTPEGEDTVVRLAHTRLKPEAVSFHDVGWRHFLSRFALAAAGVDPGSDPWRDLDTNIAELRAAGVFAEQGEP